MNWLLIAAALLSAIGFEDDNEDIQPIQKETTVFYDDIIDVEYEVIDD